MGGTSRVCRWGGEGCPEVTEFAVTEYAAALGQSTETGRRQLAKAVEAHYRLTRCWARLVAGDLPAWKLGYIADRTICLAPAAAVFVDTQVAAVAHRIGPAQLHRLITEATARFDPDRAGADRQAAADARRVDVRLADLTTAGTVYVEGEVDLADALDLETTLATGAEQQRLLGSAESLDVRRSVALGELARGQVTLDLSSIGAEAAPRPRRRRQVVLHVHLEHAAVLGAGGLARVQEAAGPVTAEQVRTWCGNPDTQVTAQPVLDLAEHLHVDSYQASTRLKLQTQLRDRTCAFPFCLRPAQRCDCEHRVPHQHDSDDGGPTCSCNLAPCCRRHPGPRPPAAGATSPSNPAPTCGDPRSATTTSATTPAPSTSPPTLNGSGSPTTSWPTSPPTSANPDHLAQHPAQPPASGVIGAPRLVCGPRSIRSGRSASG